MKQNSSGVKHFLERVKENLGAPRKSAHGQTYCLSCLVFAFESYLVLCCLTANSFICLTFALHFLWNFKQKRYKRLKKLKPIDSDEEDDDRASVGGHSADEREALAHELFEDDDAEQPPVCISSKTL